MPGLTGFYRDLCDFSQQLFELSLCDLSTELATIALIGRTHRARILIWQSKPLVVPSWLCFPSNPEKYHRAGKYSKQVPIPKMAYDSKSHAATANNSANWRCSLLSPSPALDTYGFTGCACRCRIFQSIYSAVRNDTDMCHSRISMLWICMPNEPTLGELQQTSGKPALNRLNCGHVALFTTNGGHLSTRTNRSRTTTAA